MHFSLEEIDSSWHTLFSEHLELINRILEEIKGVDIAPERANVFRAFRQPLNQVRVVIFGQDPYPTAGVADGLAFSISLETERIPASLRNIFTEYSSDLGKITPVSGNLSRWSDNGVLLLNRTLTTTVGERNVHSDHGWKILTDAVAKELGRREVVAILWGSHAQELAPYFKDPISSVHPSPLSAYRGFFGSKPFSRANALLVSRSLHTIDWTL